MKRWLAAGGLLVAGIFSLPLAALPFEESGEDWIFPLAVGGMAVLGAGVSMAVPELAGEDAGPAKRLLVGAGIGVGGSLLGTAIFWFLISGLRGA